ncbi:hypothetical protein NECAME_13733 [Necator americanus]|uniref:Collagen triple helix repeat protein n=1 Tax=Necator americanus TaxID=51031 RepID=W2STI0_NECAM|nr:hypothetical protein NECAME_13733 [Necator americanus]ETN72783.1 hypothetical protein NECAME_13733 [Necator americanus]
MLFGDCGPPRRPNFVLLHPDKEPICSPKDREEDPICDRHFVKISEGPSSTGKTVSQFFGISKRTVVPSRSSSLLILESKFSGQSNIKTSPRGRVGMVGPPGESGRHGMQGAPGLPGPRVRWE